MKLPGNLGIRDFIDILVVSFVFYQLFLLIRGTRAVQVLKGIVILIIAFFVAEKLNLHTINWILKNFWTAGLVAFVIVFQPELRRALAQMGENRFWSAIFFRKEEEDVISEVVRAAEMLANDHIGALIVIERNTGLKNYIQTGIKMDSKVTAELLTTIFTPNSLLHDGAVIIQEDRIAAAGCLLPLTDNPQLSIEYGTRHRAAIGLSEETDAVVVVVSEERGSISLAVDGRIATSLDKQTLRQMLTLYGTKESGGVAFRRK